MFRPALLLSLPLSLMFVLPAFALPRPAVIDAQAQALMARTQARGLALAVIDGGRVKYVQAYGARNAQGDALTPNTVMYGASLTKTVFAYTALQLVDQGKLQLDTPLATLLPQPLTDYPDDPRYAPWSDLKDDARWRSITPRMMLTHATGLPNFAFMEPDKKLHIHFAPGSRFAYSGTGILLLQFVLEKGLGMDAGQLTQANFERLGMPRTSLMWREDFAPDVADGWDDQGKPQPHNHRSRVRAAGSMDTTIADFARFAAALVRGDGLSTTMRKEMMRPQLHIGTRSQFMPFQPELPPSQQRKDLYAGLGVVVFDGPQGPGYFKGGHDDATGNTMVCLERGQRCLVILSNDVRAEKGYAEMVRFVLGDTGVPYDWEYGFTPGP